MFTGWTKEKAVGRTSIDSDILAFFRPVVGMGDNKNFDSDTDNVVDVVLEGPQSNVFLWQFEVLYNFTPANENAATQTMVMDRKIKISLPLKKEEQKFNDNRSHPATLASNLNPSNYVEDQKKQEEIEKDPKVVEEEKKIEELGSKVIDNGPNKVLKS